MKLFLNREERDQLQRFPELVELDNQKLQQILALNQANELTKLDLTQMYILAVGCHKHPSYRAHRKPVAGCGTCSLMLKAGDFLRGRGFTLLRALKPGKKSK